MFAQSQHDQNKKRGDAKPAPASPTLATQDLLTNNPVWRSLALRPAVLQPKLSVSQPGDAYEQEADRVAERVTSASALPQTHVPAPLLQRACACGGSCPKCSGGTQEDEGVRVQTKRTDGAGAAQAEAPPAVAHTLRSPGTTLEPNTRAFMESRFGHDFGGVRVHADTKAAESARAVRARAYTVGSDIAFGVGEYAPATVEGRRLLAHELVHVVQQSVAPSGAGARSSPARESETAQFSEQSSAGMLPPGAIQTGASPRIARQAQVLHPLAEEDLVDKFAELYARLPEKVRVRLLKYDTVAMGIAVDSDGDPRLIYTVAGNRRYRALDNVADELGITKWEPRERAEGRGKVGAPMDAEQLMLEGSDEEMRVVAIAASRIICKDCAPAMKDAGVHVVEPQKFLSRLKSKVATAPPANKPAGAKPVPAAGVEGEAVEGVTPSAPKARVPAAGGNEAVEAIATPPIPKLPKAGKTPRTKGKPPPRSGYGAAMGGAAVGVVVMLVASRYFQDLADEANAVKYEQYTRDLQPQIEATIAAQAPAIQKLTDEGQAAYANVTLRVSYMTAADIGTEISTTSLTSIRIEKITIAGSPGPVKQEEIPFEVSAREIASRLTAEIAWSYVMVSYPVKLADSLDEQKRSADDEIAFLDEVIDEINAGDDSADSDEELDELLAEREEAEAHRGRLEEVQAGIEQRHEKRRQEQAAEEKRKQRQALRKYESMQQKPPPKASDAGLLPGPGAVTPPAESLPLPAPLAAADDKIAKADEMSRLFVAQKNKLAAWAERLRASSSAGQTGTPEYQNSYRKFTTLRDPWPSQLRESLKWLRLNVPGAGQAIDRMNALDDWLKTGGWDSLNQVTKP